MPDHVLLTILVILGLVVAACAVMAVLGWVIVAILRSREARRGPTEGSEQSIVVANGVFELAGADVVFEADDDLPHALDAVADVEQNAYGAGKSAAATQSTRSR